MKGLLLCCCAAASAAFVPLESGETAAASSRFAALESPNISDVKSETSRRNRRRGEPAGVEILFSQSVAIAFKPLSGAKDLALKRLRRRNRPSRGDDQLSDEKTLLEILPGSRQCEEARNVIRSGEYGWAFNDASEEAHFAATKVLLNEEFERLRNEKLDEAYPDAYSDLRLLRFLRKDKPQQPLLTAERFRAFIRWRQDNNVDRIREEVGKSPFNPPPKTDKIASLFPIHLKYDERMYETIAAEDTVPALLPIGDWKSSALAEEIHSRHITLPDFLDYWIYLNESLNLLLHEESMRRQKVVYVDEVLDLTEMSLKQFSPRFVKNIMKPWLHLTQTFYPETTKRIYFLNPPRILKVVWSIVTPFVSPGTVAKVILHRYHGTCDDFITKGDMLKITESNHRRKGNGEL